MLTQLQVPYLWEKEEEGEPMLPQTWLLLRGCHINYTPTTMKKVVLLFASSAFFLLFFLFIPASAYQWRWVWEQRQRSSGSVSGSCRQNALGCCGLSGIRGRGETWAGQHVERKRRGQFEHKQWVKVPGWMEPDRKEKMHTRTNTTPLRYCISVRQHKKGSKHVFSLHQQEIHA